MKDSLYTARADQPAPEFREALRVLATYRSPAQRELDRKFAEAFGFPRKGGSSDGNL